MKAANMKEAWSIADSIISGDYIQDNNRSQRAGYDIYASTNGNQEYICDLGSRLEVNKADGTSVNIWIETEVEEVSTEVLEVSVNAKPLAQQLKEIKEAIKDFKGNRSFVKREEKKIIENYKEKLKGYDSQNWVDRNFINTLEKRCESEIYNLYEMYGNDATIQIIYNDGTECNVTGTEIVAGEITPKLQQIAYASYQDGYTIFDTLSGNMDDKWDIEGEDEVDWDARDEYFNNIERIFKTKWGINH